MGRWLDALKKRENGPEANLQKYQKSDLANFDTFETASFAVSQKNCDPKKIMGTAPDGTDETDNTSQMVVSSVLSVSPGGEKKFSGDQRHAFEGEKEPLFFSHPTQASERRRVIPFPGREWKYDMKAKPDDPERYLDALRAQGAASYGMMMRVLQWGGTRAGQAEDTLLEQGRIKFNERGWAYPVDRLEE